MPGRRARTGGKGWGASSEEASRDTGRSRWEAALAERRKAIGM